MALLVKILKNQEEIFRRGSDKANNALSRGIENGPYKMEIYTDRAQSNIKDIEPFLRGIFEKEPERIINDFEGVLLDYIRENVIKPKRNSDYKNIKSIITSVLNKIKNISDGSIALVLKPFILIRASNRNDQEKPFKAPASKMIGDVELGKHIAIPIEKYVRHEADFVYKDIQSALLYLSTDELLSNDFYRKLDEMLRKIDGFDNAIYDNIDKKNKRYIAIKALLKHALNKLREELSSPDIDKVSRNEHNIDFTIVEGKIVPSVQINISLSQLPPAIDKPEIEVRARRFVYQKFKEILGEVLGIQDVDRYFDFSGMIVSVNIRVFNEII